MRYIICALLLSVSFGWFGLTTPIENKVAEVKKDLVWSFVREVLHMKVFLQRGKITNGDYWVNFGARGTVNLTDDLDLKFGLSEYLTSLRSNGYFNLGNHAALRTDIGFFYKFSKDLSIGYVFSGRFPIDGYTPTMLDGELTNSHEWLELRYTL